MQIKSWNRQVINI